MQIGDRVQTPRFLGVTISDVFESTKDAYENGFNEPTYYKSQEWDILGKHTGTNRMIFASIRKPA